MEKLMIWCTCAEDNKILYLKKIVKWYQQIITIFEEYNPDLFCFVDGSLTIDDLINVDKKLLNISFINLTPKLGRKSLSEFPGWKRSFRSALEVGREYDYILHIENDLKILNAEKLKEYIFKPGYYVGRNKIFNFFDTTFMILNDKNLNEKFIQYYLSEQNLNENVYFEFVFLEIVKNNTIHQIFKSGEDYICQYDVLQNQKKEQHNINNYHIFSIFTSDLFPFVKKIAENLKKYKKENSKYTYHIFSYDDDLEIYKNKLKNLNSEDFELNIQSFNKYKNIIKPITNNKHQSAYGKCLVCQLFPDLEKILYLDVDLFIINRGLEEFMDDDIANYYIKGCIDIPISYNNKKEVENCKTNNYINTGVLLMNPKKIKQDGKDKELLKAISGNWPNELQPLYNEQTLINYILKDKILISKPKFNNILLSITSKDLDICDNYYMKWSEGDLIRIMGFAVIIHFTRFKPWKDQNIDYNIYFIQLAYFIYYYFLFMN